jgi:large subunit ribosomal protein L18
MNTSKVEKRIMRHKRIRSEISGTPERPRLSVFRSNKFISVQAIDDSKESITVASASSKNVEKGTPMEKAAEIGKNIAETLMKNGVKTVVFDRGGFIYTGQVKALAEAARSAGLKF